MHNVKKSKIVEKMARKLGFKVVKLKISRLTKEDLLGLPVPR